MTPYSWRGGAGMRRSTTYAQRKRIGTYVIIIRQHLQTAVPPCDALSPARRRRSLSRILCSTPLSSSPRLPLALAYNSRRWVAGARRRCGRMPTLLYDRTTAALRCLLPPSSCSSCLYPRRHAISQMACVRAYAPPRLLCRPVACAARCAGRFPHATAQHVRAMAALVDALSPLLAALP